jgi:ribosomal protein S18 acetylase RimI-like enzyme
MIAGDFQRIFIGIFHFFFFFPKQLATFGAFANEHRHRNSSCGSGVIFSGLSVIYLATICQRMIRYSDSHDFDPQQLLALFDQTDWARGRRLNDIQRMLAETDVTISAWDGSLLVGFSRVLTDYIYRASIWDVIVDVKYHDQDIGKGLIQRILTHPSLDHVELFWLCTRRFQGFYASLGFSDKEQTGMVWDRRKQPPLLLP